MKMFALNGEEPHPDYGGWTRFVIDHTQIRDQKDGVRFFGSSNCNYIVWPCGMIVQNYGYNGRCLMKSVNDEGAATVKTRMVISHIRWEQWMVEMRG